MEAIEMRAGSNRITILIYIILLAMSISPSFTLGDGNRNLLLIALMGLTPVVVLRYMVFDRKALLLILFMAVLILFPLLIRPETMRWTTVLYTGMFCSTFIAYSQLLHHSNFGEAQFQRFLKYTIVTYFMTLLVQQFCVLLQLPIFNVSNYDPTTPWKLNSLMSEPAHSARVVPILMYCYIYIKELSHGERYSYRDILHSDRWLWVCFLWVIVTMGSASAYLFLCIILLKLLSVRSLVSSLVLVSVLFLAAYSVDLKPAVRAKQTLLATLTFDERVVMRTDGSAAARIVPTMTLLKTVSVFSKEGLLGHGVDQLSHDRVIDMSSIGYGPKGVTGGLMTTWYENGFIAFLLFFLFSLACCINKKDLIITGLLWITMVYLFGVNNQMVWLTILLLYTNKVLTAKKISR